MQFAWKLGVVALIALVFAVLPGGGAVLDVALSLLGILFLAAIAFLGYRFYRQYNIDIDTLEPNARLALYGSIGGAILTVVGHQPPVRRGRRGGHHLVRAAGAVLVRAVLGLAPIPQLRVSGRGFHPPVTLFSLSRVEP